MIKKVISFPDGRVVFYYNNEEVTYRKNEEPEIKNKVYNKKDIYGFLGLVAGIPNNFDSFSRY